MDKIALITGANRGLGFEAARQLATKGVRVIISARDHKKAEEAQELLKKEGLDVEIIELDVSNQQSIHNAAKEIESRHGHLHVLINNAGVFMDPFDGDPSNMPSILDTKEGLLETTFKTNTVGPFLMCQAFLPLLRKSGWGRIVNVSSGMGQLNEMGAGFPAYRISKTALNAVTRIFAAETANEDICINSVCPGWVKTDMGGPNAQREPEKGVETIVWLATLKESPTGKFLRDKQEIAW